MRKRLGTWLVAFTAVIAIATAVSGYAQGGSNGFATLHMETKLGSFRLIDGQGRVEVTFSGTFLINKLKGTHEISGKLRKEYEGNGRVIYFGTGKIVVNGDFRALQWFGQDMKATWYGRGLARITGEFDKDLNTGSYYYEDPKKVQPWQTTTVTIPLPETLYGPQGTPIERSEFNKQKGGNPAKAGG